MSSKKFTLIDLKKALEQAKANSEFEQVRLFELSQIASKTKTLKRNDISERRKG